MFKSAIRSAAATFVPSLCMNSNYLLELVKATVETEAQSPLAGTELSALTVAPCCSHLLTTSVTACRASVTERDCIHKETTKGVSEKE